MLWESSKVNLVDLKKKKGRQNFGKFFENPPPPPLEKILDPPLAQIVVFSLYSRGRGGGGFSNNFENIVDRFSGRPD